jgi:hypothetical protein
MTAGGVEIMLVMHSLLLNVLFWTRVFSFLKGAANSVIKLSQFE